MTGFKREILTDIRQRMPALAPNSAALMGAQAAVLLAITDDPWHPELVLTRRAENLNSHAGEVALPGGKRDATDPDLAFTALRESH